MSEPTLDACGCCEVVADAPLENRPGLPAIAYRVGTFATFFEKMKDQVPLEQIPDGKNAGARPLALLTTRSGDDPAIALFDAAAVVGDILTFYQERIANEGFLRTAVERRSVLELARAIGYELGPGVAASTLLAFQIDEPLVTGIPGALPTPSSIQLAAGTKVQSVPTAGQLPQMFETVLPITAKTAWNAMRPLLGQPQRLAISKDESTLTLEGQGYNPACRAIYLDGTATNCRTGDLLLVRVPHVDPDHPPGSARAYAAFVSSVTVDYDAKRTRIDFAPSGQSPPVFTRAKLPRGVPDIAPLALTPENVKKQIVGRQWSESDLSAYLAIQKWDADELLKQVKAVLAAEPPTADAFAFRAKTGVFGHSAPPFITLDALQTNPYSGSSWDQPRHDVWTDTFGTTYLVTYAADVFLDRVVQGVAAGTWAVLVAPQPPSPAVIYAYYSSKKHFKKNLKFSKKGVGAAYAPKINIELQEPAGPPVMQKFLVDKVLESSLAEFAIAGKATGLRLSTSRLDATQNLLADGDKDGTFGMRTTTVYLQSEQLALAPAPIDDPLWDGAANAGATTLTLDRMVLGLAVGQTVALTGITAKITGAGTGQLADLRAIPTGVTGVEIVTLQDITHGGGYTTLTFATALSRPYLRSSVTLCANLAPATHGETTPREVLGSGDGSVANQRFQLAKPPLTYVAAPTPSGGTSTVTIRVNGVAWHEQPSLYGLPADSRAFILRHSDSGATTVIFGDGEHGARLPTGQSNIIAGYRSGTGPAGEVGAGSLTLLQSRPLGLRSVTNPLAATGSAAPEVLADARVNAPRTVRTLDRVVSISDYQDFARGFLGVGKAQSIVVWSGQRRAIHITIGSTTGGAVDPTSALYLNLVAGIRAASDGKHQVIVDNFQPAFFKLDATVIVDPDYEKPAVQAQVTAALQSAFVFAARELAQPVTEAELMALIQSVPGVVASELHQLYRTDAAPSLTSVLDAAPAHWDDALGQAVPAELLLLHPFGLSLTTVNP